MSCSAVTQDAALVKVDPTPTIPTRPHHPRNFNVCVVVAQSNEKQTWAEKKNLAALVTLVANPFQH